MKALSFMRPSWTKIILSIVLTLLSSIIVTGLNWTTKMTWFANRGFPLPFVKLFDYVKGGPCPPYNICLATNVRNFYLHALLIDFFTWYLVSCAIVLGYETVKRLHRQHEH